MAKLPNNALEPTPLRVDKIGPILRAGSQRCCCSLHNAIRMFGGATLFAIALIASSWFLQGNPLGDWVDAALYIALGCFFMYSIAAAYPGIFRRRR